MSSLKNPTRVTGSINSASHIVHRRESCLRCVQLIALIIVYLILSYPMITQAESYVDSLVINVHKDGSVSLVVKGQITPPTGVTPVGYTSLSVDGWLVFDKYTEAKVVFRATTSWIAQGSMVMRVNLSTHSPNSETQVLNGTLSLYVHVPTQGQLVINVTSINVAFENKTLKYNFNGKIKVSGEGALARQAIGSIPLIISILRQNFERDPRMSNVVSIKRLDMTIETGYTVTITFDVDFDTYRYVELYASRDQAEALRKAISTYFSEVKQCPNRIDFSLNISGNSLLIDFYSRIDCSVGDLIHALNASINTMDILLRSLSGSTFYGYLPYQGISAGQENNLIRILKLTSDMTREFSKSFDIVSSKASINITLDSRGMRLEISTPRILKKGSSSPSDTLHALQDYLISMFDQLERSGFTINKESIMSFEASMITEEGVHVKCNQKIISSIPLKELKNCTVDVERPKTEISTTTALVIGAVVAGVLVGTIMYLVLKSKGRHT